MSDSLTDIEHTLRQAEVSFVERFDSAGDVVIGFRVSVRIMDLEIHVDVPRIRTEADLRAVLQRLPGILCATAMADSLVREIDEQRQRATRP